MFHFLSIHLSFGSLCMCCSSLGGSLLHFDEDFQGEHANIHVHITLNLVKLVNNNVHLSHRWRSIAQCFFITIITLGFVPTLVKKKRDYWISRQKPRLLLF